MAVNFLSNAVKYARKRVAVAVGEQADSVVLSVADDGPGVAPDKLDLIFESYYVVPGSKPGTGIGLSSVRMIADLCGGRAWAESGNGRGCTFFYSLPAKRRDGDGGHVRNAPAIPAGRGPEEHGRGDR